MTDIEFRIAQHPFMQPLGAAARKVLMEGAQPVTFEAGQLVLRAGEPANSIYLIEDGKVAIETRDAAGAERPLQTIGAGAVLGWSWIFPPFIWHLQARALERTRTIRLDGGHALVCCEADPKVGYEIMKRMSQILIDRLHAAIAQSKP